MHAHMNECMHVYIHANACTMYSSRDMLKCGLSMSVYAAPYNEESGGIRRQTHSFVWYDFFMCVA